MSFSIVLRIVFASAVFLLAESAAIYKTEPWDGEYVIVLPKALQKGSEQKISVQIQSKNVALRIDSNATVGKQFVTGQLSVFPDGKGFVNYRIPFENYKGRSVQLFFTAFTCDGDVKKCTESPGRRLFKTNVSLPILRDPLMIFTETNKPIYKPGDMIRFRTLPLLADSLHPSQFVAGKRNALVFDVIYIVAPNKMRMAQWKKLNWLDAFRGLSFQLSKDPLFGKWKIISQIGDVEDEESFTVKEYVLPKFTVAIKAPSYVFIGDSSLKFSVCPKYTTGRPMKALVKAQLCVKPYYKSYYRRYQPRPCINAVKVLNGTKDCANFEVDTKVLELRNKKMSYWNTRAVVNATVIENGTDFAMTKEKNGGNLETAPFKLVTRIPDTYRQGLPFYGQVLTRNHDGSVRPYERITCRVATFFWNNWGFTQEYTSDANGIVNFEIPPFPQSESSVSLHFSSKQLSKTNLITLRISWPSVYHSVKKVFSPSTTYMQVYPLDRQPPQKPCASGKLRILLQSNVALYMQTIHALSTSRGSIQAIQSFEPTTAPENKCQDQDSVELGHYNCVEQADGSYKIRCLPGWKGNNCVTPICENGCVKGVCRAPNTCNCKSGWSGVACNKCEKRKGCVNGYCHYGNDCFCKKSYEGYLCNQEIKDEKEKYSTRLPVPIDTLDVKKEATYNPTTTLEDLRLFYRNLEITIDPQLYPSSKIVLWFTYKSENGSEFVATSVELKNLQDCLSKSTPVFFAFDKKKVRPGEKLTASVKTTGSGVNCALSISDIALETFGSTGGITTAALLEEINKAVDRFPRWPYPMPYRVIENDRCRPGPEPRSKLVPVRRVRRMIMPYRPSMKDSSTFFREAKTFVLSNIPIVTAPCQLYGARGRMITPMYNQRTNMIGLPAPMAMEDSARNSEPESAKKKAVVKQKVKARLRTFFPEAWKFELLENPKATYALKAPDSMTTWKSTMYCVTSKGIGLSPPDKLVVFQPFFVQLSLPYSLVRSETAKIPVKVFSYRKECSEIVLTMKPSKALNSNGPQQVTSCLCNFGQITAYFRVQPGQLGKVPIEVEAVSRPSERCPNPVGSKPVTVLADAVRRQLLVKAEGMPEEMSFGDLLCPAGGSVSTTLEVTALSKIGLTIAEGSVRAYLTWSGNVIGSSLENLDSMVRMPYGCGEQNMMSMVPSIYVLDYFTKAGIKKKEVMDKARKFIAIGYQRQLKYRLDDGSYSAFGKRDKVGSTWLTAFVFKSFVAAKKYAEIDSQVLTSALSFLLSKTRKSGCFREDGRVFSSSLKGGQGNGKDEVAITAYILGALLEANEADPSLKNATKVGTAEAVRCLNAMLPANATMKNITNYSVNVQVYSLTKWDSKDSLTKRFQEELLRRQLSKDGFKYWKAKSDEGKPPSARPWSYFVAADVETTAYALLTQLELMDSTGSSLVTVLPILRWLTSQRSERGGWYSTQDTVMALQALTSFARRTLSSGKGTDLSVTIDSSEGKRQVNVTNDNKLVLSKISIAAPNSVKVSATGNGCLVAQAIVLFNVVDTGRSGAPFALSTSATQSKDRCDRSNVRFCVRYTGSSQQSGMAVVKANMPSGWQVNAKSIEDLSEKIADKGLKLIEVDPDDKSLVLYFDFFTATESCFTFTLERVIEVVGVKPMLVQVYDYYKPHETQETSVQVATKVCEKPQGDDPKSKCPLCTGINDTSIAAVERLCAKPHYFAAVERVAEGGKWRYTQRLGDLILVWNAALKVPETCKCQVSPRAFIAVHTKWWSLSMDESVTLGGDWTVVNVDLLSKKGREKLRSSCVKKSEAFIFGYNMFKRSEKDTNLMKPEIEPPESMCFSCSQDIDPNLRNSIGEEISAKKWTIVRATETYDDKKVTWNLKDLEGRSYGSRNVNYKTECTKCDIQSKDSKAKDLLVLSKQSWKLNLEYKNETITPDGSFFIGSYDYMAKLFPELKIKIEPGEGS